MVRRCTPFVYDAWTNPSTLGIVSKIAGVELIPNMNFEIGHINISVKSEKDAKAELHAIERERQSHADDEGIAGCPWEDDKPVVGWHTDSYPFVCVTMLSDCTDMVGGETALRTGNGDIMKVRGPQMVRDTLSVTHWLRLLTLTRAAPSSCKAATSRTKPCAPLAPKNASQW